MHMLDPRLEEAKEKVYKDQYTKARPSIERRASTAPVLIDRVAEYKLNFKHPSLT